ncbi:unnamed protein product [Brassica oleracea]
MICTSQKESIHKDAVKPTPWPLVLDLVVEIRTEKGAPVGLINLESSTIEEEPIRCKCPPWNQSI